MNWRIHRLVQLEVISRVGRGKFTLDVIKKFQPVIEKKEQNIHNALKKNFPFINYCIWNTRIFQDLSIHQTQNHFIIIEVEQDAIESVFQYIKGKHKNVFFKPKRNIIENYILAIKQPIIIHRLVTEAPIQFVQEMPTSSIEKLLVDLLSLKELLYFYQGNELVSIFQRTFDKYTINESALLRYAARRKKKAEVQEIMNAVS